MNKAKLYKPLIIGNNSNNLKEYMMIVVGCILMAIGTSLFLLPNQLSSGGFAGIATIIYYLFKFPLGIVMLVLNIPLFIIAFVRVGK